MASLKAEKPVESQTSGQAKKEGFAAAPKAGASSKGPSSKLAPKKTPQKSQDSKKKVLHTHTRTHIYFSKNKTVLCFFHVCVDLVGLNIVSNVTWFMCEILLFGCLV